MIVTFKENYDVRVCDENNYQSGIFTFMSGKGYEAEYKKTSGCRYLFVYDKDKKVKLMFDKFDEERYLV